MRINISDDIANRHPDLYLGIVVAKQVNNCGGSLELDKLLAAGIKEAIAAYPCEESLSHDWQITRWREIYRAMGINPQHCPSVLEASFKKIISGNKLPPINKVSAIGLLAMLSHRLPFSGYDLEKVAGNIALRLSPGGEAFTSMEETGIQFTKPGEIVYGDDNAILRRFWNAKEAAAAKITEDSRNILLHAESFSSLKGVAYLETVMDGVAGMIEKFCKGTARTHIINVATSLSLYIN